MTVCRSPLEFPEKIAEGDHLVQFYRSRYFLAETVVNFVAPALLNGEGVVILATEKNSELFQKVLTELLHGLESFISSGQLIMANAEDVREKILVNGVVCQAQFDELIGTSIKQMKRKYESVKVYGELVNVLWSEGSCSAAIELEKIWCHFLQQQKCTLLCAYSLDLISEEKNELLFHKICSHHSHVIPAEGVIDYDNPRIQLQNISELQFNEAATQKELKTWKVSSLEMMIPLTAMRIQLEEMNLRVADNEENINAMFSLFLATCNENLLKMKSIVENLSI